MNIFNFQNLYLFKIFVCLLTKFCFLKDLLILSHLRNYRCHPSKRENH